MESRIRQSYLIGATKDSASMTRVLKCEVVQASDVDAQKWYPGQQWMFECKDLETHAAHDLHVQQNKSANKEERQRLLSKA